MKNIVELESYLTSGYLHELNPLQANTIAKWGQMNAQQMIEHLALATKVSNGAIDVQLSSDQTRADKLKRVSLISDRPLPQGFQNPILPLTPLPTETTGLEEAKQLLADQIKDFMTHFANREEGYTRMHNMYGPLTYHEWLWFHYKHFQHHFTQFGLI